LRRLKWALILFVSSADKDVLQNFTCRHGTSATPHHVSSRHASQVSLPSRSYHRLLDVATRCCMRGIFAVCSVTPSAATWITSARTINRLTVHHRHHHRGLAGASFHYPPPARSILCFPPSRCETNVQWINVVCNCPCPSVARTSRRTLPVFWLLVMTARKALAWLCDSDLATCQKHVRRLSLLSLRARDFLIGASSSCVYSDGRCCPGRFFLHFGPAFSGHSLVFGAAISGLAFSGELIFQIPVLCGFLFFVSSAPNHIHIVGLRAAKFGRTTQRQERMFTVNRPTLRDTRSQKSYPYPLHSEQKTLFHYIVGAAGTLTVFDVRNLACKPTTDGDLLRGRSPRSTPPQPQGQDVNHGLGCRAWDSLLPSMSISFELITLLCPRRGGIKR